MESLNYDTLESFRRSCAADPLCRTAGHILSKAPLNDVCYNGQSQRDMTHLFSLEIPTLPACDQKNTGRCWLYAALNLMREAVARDLKLEDFELSQSYLCFYDHLEKANTFLEHILSTAGDPLEDRYVSRLLSSPIGDGGWWEYFQGLCLKYGICPREAMPETRHSSDTGDLNDILCRQLRKDALTLRNGVAQGESLEVLRKQKLSMVERIYKVLTAFLGEPPEAFDFAWRDKEDAFHRDPGLTPRAFYEKYIGWQLTDMVSILNAPLPDVPYHSTCYTEGEESIFGAFRANRLNLPLEEFKAAVLRQLQAGEPVWFVCDCDYYEGREAGIWDPDLYDYEGLLGLDLELSKGELLQLRQCSLNHAMVFTGVDLQEGKPAKWKIQNSWGTDKGQKGYFVCSDSWFDRYVYTATIRLAHLTEQQRSDFQKTPQILPPWHVLG